ncbi:MAG: hypothetical protein ABIH46_09240 [Chloroflexota bacterium]
MSNERDSLRPVNTPFLERFACKPRPGRNRPDDDGVTCGKPETIVTEVYRETTDDQ